MNTKTIDSGVFYGMLRAGSARLGANKTTVNDLNVFPIPDGDTGDNMFMTIDSGVKSASGLKGAGLGELASAASKGMLLGARGNSGVILSRIFAGIARGLDGLDTADVAAFDHAMQCAVEESYNAVSNPVEGTILTVLKDSVAKAGKSGADSLEGYFGALLPEMEASLERTPDLLPVLKEAGVVDSGGSGLLCIAQGMSDALEGKAAEDGEEPLPAAGKTHAVNLDAFGPDSELGFGYCTEFLLRLQTSKVDLATFDVNVIKDYLDSVGESVVCFREGSIVKVHVHTRKPGDILNKCQTWGEYLTLKIENMTLQHEEIIKREAASEEEAPAVLKKIRKPLAIVTVASGEGLAAALREAGADEVVEGGQTMNPSAAAFIEAFDRLDAENILVFPNNSNIILTAQQAAELYDKSRVAVVPTRNFGSGYVGIASVDHGCKDLQTLAEAAAEAAGSVVTGLVSKAIRDTLKDGVDVHEGDYVGFSGSEMLADSPVRSEAALALCEAIGAAEHDVVLVFAGSDVDGDESEALARELGKKYRRTEFIMNAGGQPVYDYIFVLC